MKRKLFFAFSAFMDELELELDVAELVENFKSPVAGKTKEERESAAKAKQMEYMIKLIYKIMTKIHKAKSTYIPFVCELLNCTEEEAEEKDVEDVLKIAFTNNDVKSFFTLRAR